MPKVELRNIRNFVCQGTNLEVMPAELLVLLGPNGAGKTTLLNVMAGLVEYEGSVTFDGAPVDAVPPRDRKVGYLFQDLALFPHMDVRSNIAFGLNGNGRSRREVSERVEELLDLLAIHRIATRYPAKLSGGEKQRVALARALATRPAILLLDEPFSSLDALSSSHLRAELKCLQRDLGVTTIFVTHDVAEAEGIADRIAVIQDGVVCHTGTPEDVLSVPRDRNLSAVLGWQNVLECRAALPIGRGLVEAECAGMPLLVPHNGREVRRVAIAARDVQVTQHRPRSDVNVFKGIIRQTSNAVGVVLTDVDVNGCHLTAELPQTLFENLRLSAGSEVFVELSLMKMRTGS